jgi:anti-sigma-K factor RskA
LDRSQADNRDGDLAWTALRYALDELSTEDAAAFEARMADEPAACEALAAATADLCDLRSAFAVSQPMIPSTTRPTAGGFLAFAFMAVALVFLVASFLFLPFWRRTGVEPGGLTLAKSAAALDANSEVALAAVAFVAANADDFFDEPTQCSETENLPEEISVPNWLVEAIAHADDPGGAAP